MNNKIWNVALYIRLSVEDEEDCIESNSISNQRKLLDLYVKDKHDLKFVDYYIDDGYTGTNFNRPGFKRMLNDIKDGKINAVLVKDLSRLGRNYIEVGNYIDQIFPLYKTRFIALNDNIDSYNEPDSANNIMVSFKNLLNDEYCRDISNKVKSVFNAKRRNGEFIGSVPPYGYKRDPKDKHHFVVDKEAANVVKLIFKLALEGNGKAKIAGILNDKGILPMSEYKIKNSLMKSNPNRKKAYWADANIDSILRNETYCGDMIQGKRKNLSYKNKKSIKIPKEDWLVVRNTHEAIIDRETFKRVNDSLFTRDTRVGDDGNLSLFVGYLKCADCGRSMKKFNSNSKSFEAKYGRKRHVFYCSTYVRQSHNLCTKHMIREDELSEAVIKAIKLQINLVIDMEKTIKEIMNTKKINYNEEVFGNNLKNLDKELDKYKLLKKKLYEDWKLEIITKEEYLEYSKDYDKNISRLNKNISNINEQLRKAGDIINNNDSWITKFKQNAQIEKLTRSVLDDLVENIYIHEDKHITIKYKYEENYKDALEFIEDNKK